MPTTVTVLASSPLPTTSSSPTPSRAAVAVRSSTSAWSSLVGARPLTMRWRSSRSSVLTVPMDVSEPRPMPSWVTGSNDDPMTVAASPWRAAVSRTGVTSSVAIP